MNYLNVSNDRKLSIFCLQSFPSENFWNNQVSKKHISLTTVDDLIDIPDIPKLPKTIIISCKFSNLRSLKLKQQSRKKNNIKTKNQEKQLLTKTLCGIFQNSKRSKFYTKHFMKIVWKFQICVRSFNNKNHNWVKFFNLLVEKFFVKIFLSWIEDVKVS